jgi:hypothetical protein
MSPPPPPPSLHTYSGVGGGEMRGQRRRGRMKGGRVGWVEAEGEESEGENQRGLSQKGRCGGGGEGRPASPPPYQYLHTTTHNTAASKLFYTKLQKYGFLIWSLYLIILRRANPLLGHWKGWALEISIFFGPKWHSLRW